MPLDYDPSDLISLARVGPVLESRGLGKVTRQTAWLWATKGFQKDRNSARRIKLRTVESIGRHYTTVQWVLAFVAECRKT